MLLEVMRKVQLVPGEKGTGVFYWESEGARSWSQYPLSAWGDNGRPNESAGCIFGVSYMISRT